MTDDQPPMSPDEDAMRKRIAGRLFRDAAPLIEEGEDEIGRYLDFMVPRASDDGVVTHRMRWIPPGTFMMGSPPSEDGRRDDEGPQHEVTLTGGYWLGETPVTQALFVAVTGENPSNFKGDDQRPVETVSWDDAQAFIEVLNKLVPTLNARLPTEAEWEYACRAGTTGSRYGDVNDIAKQSGSSWGTTYAKSKRANGWGLYDMLGNVWEWCDDVYAPYSRKHMQDPARPAAASSVLHRMIRGGAWGAHLQWARAAARLSHHHTYSGNDVGFRLARGQASAQAVSRLDGPIEEPEATLGPGDRGPGDGQEEVPAPAPAPAPAPPVEIESTVPYGETVVSFRAARGEPDGDALLEGEHVYERMVDGWPVPTRPFGFDPGLKERLQRLNADDSVENVDFVSQALRGFLLELGVNPDTARGRLTFRTDSRRLGGLPIELAYRVPRPPLGLAEEVSVRYQTPLVYERCTGDDEGAGAVVVAYSGARQSVPHEEHIDTLAEICRRGLMMGSP